MREKLNEKSVLLGLSSTYPAEGIIERLAEDWDWVWIDGQHGQYDYRSIIASVRAADLGGIESMVRVPSHDPGGIATALDTGASGVIVPQVENAEQARLAVQGAKFAPVGFRSFGGRRPIDLYGRSFAHTANRDLILTVQIESRVAIENAEEILSVAGVDAFIFGADDLSMVDGLPMDEPRPKGIYDEEMKNLAAIAQKYDVIPGAVMVTPESVRSAVDMGYRLLAVGGDSGFLANASSSHRAEIDAALSTGVPPLPG